MNLFLNTQAVIPSMTTTRAKSPPRSGNQTSSRYGRPPIMGHVTKDRVVAEVPRQTKILVLPLASRFSLKNTEKV